MYCRLVLGFDSVGLVQSVLADPNEHRRIATNRRVVLRPPQGRIALGDAAIICVAVLLLFHPRRECPASDGENGSDLVPGATQSCEGSHLLGVNRFFGSAHNIRLGAYL